MAGWQEGREDQEHDRLWAVLEQWDHATPPPGGYRPVEETMARIDAKHAERERERRDRPPRMTRIARWPAFACSVRGPRRASCATSFGHPRTLRSRPRPKTC